MASSIKQVWYFFKFMIKNVLTYHKDGEYSLYTKKYVTLSELFRLKSKNHSSSVLLGKEIGITDSFWHLHSLKEIFSEDVYLFRSENKAPYILDCGSNIGLSVIYFKRLFPQARIVAFEPDPRIFNLLKNNLHAFNYDDVTVKNTAIWREETELTFYSEGSLGGKLDGATNGSESNRQLVKVPTDRLRNYLNEKVDFLKMDIEGPEVDVMEDCADLLKNVQNIFVEYHSEPVKEQQLDRLLSILKNAGFKVYIKEAWNNLTYPYIKPDHKLVYDMQLNIFGYRPN